MSLINDVLRQVDTNENAHASAKAGVSSILPAATVHADGNYNIPRLIFISSSSLLILILILQLVLDKSLFSLFENDRSYIYSPQNSGINSSALISREQFTVIKDDSVIDRSISSENSSSVESIATEDITPKVVSPVRSDAPAKFNDVVKFEVSPEPITLLKVNSSKVVLPKVERKNTERSVTVSSQPSLEGEDEYQKALRFFIADNISAADKFIKLALNKNNIEKYHLLQARVFIKQKNSDGFYALVKEYPDNESLDWFKLIAPGLQLFSYYQLSNQYYYSLIKAEPDQIRWQLAVALNYLRLGDKEKAISTYHQLYQSDQVSNQQKQWLIKKIERLSAKKV